MYKMKTKVKAILTNKISRMKIFGLDKFRGKIGSMVMASVKEGEFANPISRKGTKHRAIVITTTNRNNSKIVKGVFDCQHMDTSGTSGGNKILLIKDSSFSLFSLNGLHNYPILSDARFTLQRLAAKAKRKDIFSLSEV